MKKHKGKLITFVSLGLMAAGVAGFLVLKEASGGSERLAALIDENLAEGNASHTPSAREFCQSMVGAAGGVWLLRPSNSLADQMERVSGSRAMETLVLLAYSIPAGDTTVERERNRSRYLDEVEFQCYAALSDR